MPTVATIETLVRSGNRGFEGGKSSVGSTFVLFFVYVRQNSISEFEIQILYLSFYFHIRHRSFIWNIDFLNLISK